MTNEQKKMVFPPDFLIADKYKLGKMLGRGSFGEVYLAQDILSNNQVAIKIEESKNSFSQLEFESKVYRFLANESIVPSARLYIIDSERRALVMEHLGPSLEDLHRKCGRRFSLKTVCLLAEQMLILLEYIHSRSILHRDIKPDNFLMGINNPSRVYIVDFGLAKQYCISRVVPHVKYNNKKCMIGTARYASINAHNGVEQSRRDDLESLGFVLLYFLLGQLPWQGLSGETKSRKYNRIFERKLSTTVDVLCRHAPQQFNDYINYVRSLRFDQKPDYMELRQLFRNTLQFNNLRFDDVYDWTNPTIAPIKQPDIKMDTRVRNPVTPYQMAPLPPTTPIPSAPVIIRNPNRSNNVNDNLMKIKTSIPPKHGVVNNITSFGDIGKSQKVDNCIKMQSKDKMSKDRKIAPISSTPQPLPRYNLRSLKKDSTSPVDAAINSSSTKNQMPKRRSSIQNAHIS